jgi:chromosome segregation ATPase
LASGSKFLNRRKRKHDSAEDEWEHATGSVGEKIEVTDILDVQDRSLTFGDQENIAETNYDMYKEEKERVIDDMSNTAQYIKFANESIKLKKDRLETFNEKQRKFQEEVDALKIKKLKTREELNNTKYKEIKSPDIKRALEFLEKDRKQIKQKIEHFSTQLSHAKTDLVEKDKQMQEIKAELDMMNKRENVQKQSQVVESDPIEIIKSKICSLADSQDKKEILDEVNSLLSQLKSKK